MSKSMTFDQWKVAVDTKVQELAGLSADDLPDCPYRDWYDEGMQPKTAARKAIANAKE